MSEEDIYNTIVNSKSFQKEKEFMQHGSTSVYDHSLYVTKTCFSLVKKLHLKVNKESLMKGALLHDYFLYDWHEKDSSHRLHGFRHAKFAHDNALRDFGLNKKEKNMILAHMFPLGYRIPRYKESIILCLVDKYCATVETFSPIFKKNKDKNKERK